MDAKTPINFPLPPQWTMKRYERCVVYLHNDNLKLRAESDTRETRIHCWELYCWGSK